MEINVIIEDGSVYNYLNEEWFHDEAEKILNMAKAGFSEMGILVINDLRMQEINKAYRNIDKTTDVLSFQMENDDGFIVPNDMRHLGDVIISVPTAVRQAKKYGVSIVEEVRRLLIHGILHLLGYDHILTQQKEEMHHLEENIMSRLEEWDE